MPTEIEKIESTPLRGTIGDEDTSIDIAVNNLLDPNRLVDATRRADAERKALSNKEWRRLRVRAKKDLFFLCTGILGYKRLSPRLHGHFCSHIEATSDYRFRMYLLPRFHFKSTIRTISKNIQIVLPFDDYDRQQALDDGFEWEPGWPDILGPEVRIMIGHETATGSARFLYSIASHFLSNSTLQMLFPEIVPKNKEQRINKWELELPRYSNHPEPTIDTMGVGAKSQGRHYNSLTLDDIFGRKARDSVVEMQTTIEWSDSIQMFFDAFAKDKADWVGTRYSYDDVYGHVRDVYGDQLVYYRRSVTEANEQGIQEPIFPEEITLESLEILKKNKKEYNSQMLNDPDASAEGFPEEYKRYFYWISRYKIVAFIKSPFSNQPQRIVRDIRDMDLCCVCDPGLGKTGGIAITGMDWQQRIFILESSSLEDMNHSNIVELLFSYWHKYHYRLLAIESDVFMSVYEHWLNMEMPRRGISFIVEPVVTRQRTKDERIKGLGVYMSSEQFFYNENQDVLDVEMDRFGKTKDIHILDAIAYGPEVWRPGFMEGMRSKMSEYSNEGPKVHEDLDEETGYSAI